jgi:uncharacterized protein YceK
MRRTVVLLLAVCPLMLGGCGTFFDALAGPVDDHYYYRGVRLDVAAVNDGVPIMALDLPLSALVDTFMIPAIAYEQWTDPPGTQRKPALQVAGEEMAKEMGQSIATELIAPMATEMMKANAASQQQQTSPPVTPVGGCKD